MALPPEAFSRLNHIVIPALDKIIKSSSWRRGNSKLIHQCKALHDSLSHNTLPNFSKSNSAPDSPDSSSSVPGPLSDLSFADCEFILKPLIFACKSNNIKFADPALNCFHKLISYNILIGEADQNLGPSSDLLFKVIEAICVCHTFRDDAFELLVVKVLFSAMTSTSLKIHGDCLLLIVKTCYDLYLLTKNVVNQTTAKASLIQILVLVFRRMEADCSTAPEQPAVVAEMMDSKDKDMNQVVQGFIGKVSIDGTSRKIHDGGFDTTAVEQTNAADLLESNDKDMLDVKYWEFSMYKTALEGRKDELGGEVENVKERDDDEEEEEDEVQIGNKLKRDVFLVFRALCKLSMKTPPKDASMDQAFVPGKIFALELLKFLLENAGLIFRTSNRFLGAVKQYLCISLLKNSASVHLIVFELSCSIFMSLVSRFRPGLKAEIGVFFPTIILRVLENVAQPIFQQKMIVLRFLEKLCVDSQMLADIFVNYDCDVHSPNIFERMVNGLLKTAQGPPSGVATTLIPPNAMTMKTEAMKCLVAIMKSLCDWMNKQLQIPEPLSPKSSETLTIDDASGTDTVVANGNGEVAAERMSMDSNSEYVDGISEVAALEQRRAYKLELQEGINLFNRKPMKGIEFLIKANKIGDAPEEIAAFLKSTSGLNKTLIGDFLGEREDLSLKVMHAYVDSFSFHGMNLDDAIRTFLQRFRLPGEAQKIDRIMEKFAERFCKCNPKAFSSADTAYVLAYSVIMLNTDAHSPMVKDKMSADDFIRNNSGIDDGKDLPEEYMRSLYERITKNEIKMKDDDWSPQHMQSMNSKRIPGLDNILNIVIRKRGDQLMETNDDLIRHMQEQFKEKTRKSESVYYAATDIVILRFMIEVCWAPMLAAFSVLLDQSDDIAITTHCIEGFKAAIHVTAVMSLKTHRDAFVTSLAKFTSLHSASDIKQKNIDAIKAILSIANEDGNYMQEAWEHILACVSRFEHLHLLIEGSPTDATFFAIQQGELDLKQAKSSVLPVLKKKGPGQVQNAPTLARRGSFDSVGVDGHTSGAMTSDQTSKLILKKLFEQVDISEMNHVFIHSQMLNSEAVIDFVKALCKVSTEELRSVFHPRVFSLTKIVEIAHYNMDRIRLVWSSIWHVLSEFFVTTGCSENLSIAIFAIDSLRQLAIKFLEREELANYKFQNEFMKPFVVLMRRSRAVEIRELIIRCISQMVLTRVDNVKSGWKSIFMVLTTASYDEHKNIVQMSFEIVEKIVRDYFPYITETETTAFTDCVNCLIAFINSRFNIDISLNAISILSVCAGKLADGNIGFTNKDGENDGNFNRPQFTDKDGHQHFWFPLLAGLSELTFDLRPKIRESAMQTLFEILHDYGHHFPLQLWGKVFDSVLFPIIERVRHVTEPSNGAMLSGSTEENSNELNHEASLYETCKLALQSVVDLFTKFYDTVNPLLEKIIVLLTSFIKRPHQSLAGIGISAFVRLVGSSGYLFVEDKWYEVVVSLKEAAVATQPDFSLVSETNLEILIRDKGNSIVEFTNEENAEPTDQENKDSGDDLEALRSTTLYFAINDAKCRAAVQLLLLQAVMGIYSMFRAELSSNHTTILFEAVHSIASHARKINSDALLRLKLSELGPKTQMLDPPLLRLENESYQHCLTLLQNLIIDKPIDDTDKEVCNYLITLCMEIFQAYLDTSNSGTNNQIHWRIQSGPERRRELASRAPTVVCTLQAIQRLGHGSEESNLAKLFPLLSGLIKCEHGSNEVQVALSYMLDSWAGPILLRSC